MTTAALGRLETLGVDIREEIDGACLISYYYSAACGLKAHSSSSFVKCIYFLCSFLCLVMKATGKREARMPHCNGKASLLYGGASDRVEFWSHLQSTPLRPGAAAMALRVACGIINKVTNKNPRLAA